MFTTEGHPIPIDHPLLRQPAQSSEDVLEEAQHSAAMCPAKSRSVGIALVAELGAGGPDTLVTAAGRQEADQAAVPDHSGAQPAADHVGTVLLPGGCANSASSSTAEQAAAAAPAGSTATGKGWEEDERQVALDVGFGSLHSNRSALDALVCPDYAMVRIAHLLIGLVSLPLADPLELVGRASSRMRCHAAGQMAGAFALVQGQVVSVCHIRDWQDGAACRAHSDCGIDGRSCRRRLCSEHGFCVTPEQVLHLDQTF